ncbi:cell division protein FtsZ [Helicobacter sp. MIT 21-1697]|uniref:cell division protein FtsZ n=1 Tax=Helicobacter sp. MIT 21-1697 TaxID=2993733 RepID=UPI00224A6C32|nr:cell division protein FtsZ [Helicobacter sp. MIT 21-1697]MCX2717024.1 cell division protein FtsZ [Helicobacter sp. MIT 21-1697]
MEDIIQEIQPKAQNAVIDSSVNISIQEIQDETSKQGAVIAVIGVGGGGSNMVNYLANNNPHKDVKLIAANTDVQALTTTQASLKMKLGERLTKGLGAGMRPEVGEKAALETYEEIKAVLKGADIVFISAGLGGGTGTGAAPVIAKAAKEVGALTVSIVTKPFKYEGAKRTRLAEEGLRNLKAESDCIIVIPNERLLNIIPKNCSRKDSFAFVDNVLAQAVNGMSSVILNHTQGDINVDFADVQTIMNHRGLALMGIGEATGDNAAYDAVQQAIVSPLLDNISIKGAKGVVVCIESCESYPQAELAAAMNEISSIIDQEADFIQGMHTLYDVPEDFVRITVIATGFEKEIVNGSNDSLQKTEQELALEHSRQNIQLIRNVSGEDYNLFNNSDALEVPTYLRNQKD